MHLHGEIAEAKRKKEDQASIHRRSIRTFTRNVYARSSFYSILPRPRAVRGLTFNSNERESPWRTHTASFSPPLKCKALSFPRRVSQAMPSCTKLEFFLKKTLRLYSLPKSIGGRFCTFSPISMSCADLRSSVCIFTCIFSFSAL